MNDLILRKFRDLSIADTGEQTILFACDSSGGVGSLAEDDFQTPALHSGIFMVKVVLMEIIAAGAVPVAVYADFCYDRSDYTDEVMKGVMAEVASVGVDPSVVHVSYGTAKDPLCSSTGAVVVGTVAPENLRLAVSDPGDVVYVIGCPRDKDYMESQLSNAALCKLRQMPFIKEIVPCGSHGFRYEAETLAQTNGLIFREEAEYALKEEAAWSCGACCCAVFTVSAEDVPLLQDVNLSLSLCRIGSLEGERRPRPKMPRTKSHSAPRLRENGNIAFENGLLVTSHALSYGVGQREKDPIFRPVTDLVTEMVLCAGKQLGNSRPVLLVNDLNFPMEPDGKRTIDTLLPLLRQQGIDPAVQFTGSTEDNHPGPQTGVAIRWFGWKENT